MTPLHGTTVLSVRRGGRVAIGGDGQVSLGDTVMKSNARKVRRLHKDRVIAGFAGGTADAFTLFERFEGKLEKHQGQLVRAAVELMQLLARACGHRHLNAFNPDDLTTFNRDMAYLSGVKYAGVTKL